MCGHSSRLTILSDNDRKTTQPMENLREQIFQATSNFVAAVQQLTEQHTAQVLQETFSSLGGSKPRATSSTATTVAAGASRSRGAKRGPDELEHLSKRFVQFVQDNPGLRIEQINKQLGTTTTELALPIRKLVSSGDLTVKGQKRSTTYFAGKRAAAPAVASEGKTAGKTSKKSARSKKNRTGRSKSKKK
jgi:hypothetical protein